MANPTSVVGTDHGVEFFSGVASLADMVLGFIEEREWWAESCSSEGPDDGNGDEEDDDRDSIGGNERKAFWEKQHQLLEASLHRSSPLESRIRKDTKQAVKDSQSVAPICICNKPLQGGGVCRKCLLRDISDRLRSAGYNSALCKSKWRSSPCIPSGEHTYIDVVDTSCTKEDGAVARVVIELDLRGEFEMARGSPEYERLIQRLPRVYIGKAERLRSLIKILCKAAKMCMMKENNMHLGPWRRHHYMLAKWFGTCQRTVVPLPLSSPLAFLSSHCHRKNLRASMLTSETLDTFPAAVH